MWIRFSLFFGLSTALVNPVTYASDHPENINEDPTILRFGNSAEQYFRLLDLDGTHLLVGARDIVYNISVKSLKEEKSIGWSSSEGVVNECLMKGKPKNDCHNYIRVLSKDEKNGILICGTNAFKPLCRTYDRDKYGEYIQKREFSGIGISPYDPSYNSSFLRDGNLLYAATVSDFSGVDPLIHRRNVSMEKDRGIRTMRLDVKYLDKPQFVGTFRDETYVYIWFREQVSLNADGRRTIRSRIARLCRSDNGGPRSYSTAWTSFVKADLNCSIPGNYPLYLDKIEAISGIVYGNYTGDRKASKLVYAVFRSPFSGIRTSAICAFNLTHINNLFATSTFRRRQINSHTWPTSITDKIRPGRCVNDSGSLNEETFAFLRANPLMDDSIQSHYTAPLYKHSAAEYFTQIAVDPQVKALDGRRYDVLYVATDRGSVFKIVNLDSSSSATQSTHLISTISVTNESVRNLMLYKSEEGNVSEKYLIVVTDSSVLRIPAVRCEREKTCFACISLRDPHCVWDKMTGQCIALFRSSENYKQDVNEGQAAGVCPEISENFSTSAETSALEAEAIGTLSKASSQTSSTKKIVRPEPEYNRIEPAVLETEPGEVAVQPCICESRRIEDCEHNRISSGISSESASSTYKSQTNVLILCVGVAVLSLLLGFLVGSLYSYWRIPSKDQISLCGSSLRQSPQPVLAGTLPAYSVKSVINAYESAPKPTVQTLSSPLALEVECLSKEQPERVAWGTSTLPRNYRVRQVYL